MTTLLIDNYDSFTWNVYQYLSQLGATVVVVRNDQVTLDECIALNPRNVVISPGPGHPSSAGISNDCIRYFAGKVPILGVCLGEQAIYEVFGGTVTYAGELIHGKTSPIRHDGRGLYEGLNQGFEVTRYHSLAGDPKTLPDVLEITSTTDSGLIMGVRHKHYVVEGVQYHPESVSSENGYKMFANFLKWEGCTWETLSIREDLVREVARLKSKSKSLGAGLDISEVIKLNSTNNRVEKMESTTGEDSILMRIKQQRIVDVHTAKAIPGQGSDHLEQMIALDLVPPLINFYDRLISHSHDVCVLAEIKRASPSKGNIDLFVNVPRLASSYAKAGSVAISVLTEPKWFKGHLNDMQVARRALEGLPNRPAILRKDFIIDQYQILEARCYGADTILLIVAILSDTELGSLMSYSRLLGMEPLVEVANEVEMERAIATGAKVIGVNNRDLHTFCVDMNRTSTLANLVPSDVFLIALSGITTRADVEKYIASGARGILVGEALMKSANPQVLIRSLIGLQPVKKLLHHETSKRSKVKICGITRTEDFMKSIQEGADFLGMIFAPSPRKVTVSQAKSFTSLLGRNGCYLQGKPFFASSSWFQSCQQWLDKQLTGTDRPLTVGVFSNSEYTEINSIVKEAALDLVQLHGDESPDFARLISVPVIKAIHIMEDDSFETVLSKIQQFAGSAHFILLDTGVKGKSQQGGTGTTFNWNIATEIQNLLPIMVAGGLTPVNVEDVLTTVHPWCVDVSSGLEMEKGIKTPDKIENFMSHVSRK